MTTHYSRLFFVIGLLLWAGWSPVCAESLAAEGSTAVVRAADGEAAPAPVLLAQSWSLGRWFSGSGGRTRVVQFCVVTMCVALFIMMRKLR